MAVRWKVWGANRDRPRELGLEEHNRVGWKHPPMSRVGGCPKRASKPRTGSWESQNAAWRGKSVDAPAGGGTVYAPANSVLDRRIARFEKQEG